MASRDPERRYQRDKVDQLELTQKPFGGIVFPAAVPPSLSAMRPKAWNNPAVQLVEALANLGAAVVVAPSSADRVDRFNQLSHPQWCYTLPQGPDLILESVQRLLRRNGVEIMPVQRPFQRSAPGCWPGPVDR